MEQQQQHDDGDQQCLEKKPCFVLIRFSVVLQQTCKNSLIKQGSIHKNYAGFVSGVCGKMMKVLEGNRDGPSKGIAMMFFHTVEEARRWYYSCPEIKQQDWLGGVDIIIVPVCEMPDVDTIHFVQLLDITFHDVQSFAADYSPDASNILKQHNARQIVSTPKSIKLRGGWDPNYIVINAWGNVDCFEKAYHGDENQKLLSRRQGVSDATVFIFDLEPLF